MRRRVPSLAALLALAGGAVAFDRYEALPGETFLADTTAPGDVDEYVLELPRDCRVTIAAAGTAPGDWRPALGFFSNGYANLSGQLGFVAPPGAVSGRKATLRSSRGVPETGRYRVIVQAGDLGGAANAFTIGAYRAKVSAIPSRRFTLRVKPNDTERPTEVDFAAFPGFEASVQVRWRGPEAVTLLSVTDPDGVELTASKPLRSGRAFLKQAGLTTTALGEYRVALDVPTTTVRWNVVVRLRGRLPRGTQRDVRVEGVPRQPTVRLGVLVTTPAVAIVGERGGANDMALSSARFDDGEGGVFGIPAAFGFDAAAHGRFPAVATRDGPGDPPTAYRLAGRNGLLAQIENVVYDAQGVDILSYDAPLVRGPRGAGSARLEAFTYDDDGNAVGWTETRTFDGSGRVHVLVVSRVERFSNGALKAYRVRHIDPDGRERDYDFAPFTFR